MKFNVFCGLFGLNLEVDGHIDLMGKAAKLIGVLLLALFAGGPVQAAPSSAIDAVTPLAYQAWTVTGPSFPDGVIPTYASLDAACAALTKWGRSCTVCIFTYVGSTYYPGMNPAGTINPAGTCNYINDGPYAFGAYSYISLATPAVCPPATPAYMFNPSTKMCERFSEELKITLSGGTTTLPWQPSTDPKHDHPESNLSFQAIVKDQNGQPKANTKVTIETVVTDNSGGHMHTADRPKGRLKAGASVATLNGVVTIIKDVVTDGSGLFAFTFGADEAAGIHTITANCEGCTVAVSLTVHVKVDKLAPIPTSPFYSLQLPNRDTNHPNTHFLTATSSKKLDAIATLYFAQTYYQSKQGVVPDFVLNDASLEWGGVLDCFLTCNSAKYPSTPWHKAHTEHRRGSVVDVKANGSLGSIVYEAKFRKIALKEGVDIGDPHGSGSGRHFHIRLNNGAKE